MDDLLLKIICPLSTNGNKTTKNKITSFHCKYCVLVIGRDFDAKKFSTPIVLASSLLKGSIILVGSCKLNFIGLHASVVGANSQNKGANKKLQKKMVNCRLAKVSSYNKKKQLKFFLPVD